MLHERSRDAFRRSRPPRFAQRCERRWTQAVDWLGACRPTSLICGMSAIIAVIAVVNHLLLAG